MAATRLARLLLLQAAFLSGIPLAHGNEEEVAEGHTTDKSTESKPKCGIYLAPSTIPGSGLGMYAGDHDYEENETVTLGDVIIPIIEYKWNTKKLGLKKRSFLWGEYYWDGDFFRGGEEEGDDVGGIWFASPGVGAAANSYITLVNVEDTYTKLSRGMSAESPGVGAISPYHDRSFYATKKIPAGGEIFVNYGESYFSGRTRTYGYLPLPNSFKAADRLIRRFNQRKKKIKKRLEIGDDEELWHDMWSVITEQKQIWEKSRQLNALPENQTMFTKEFFDKGGSSQQHLDRSFRDISWLEEHGQCMDNIKVGQSEIPDAGRGAFANRFIPQGGLVSPAPLIHVASYDYVKMFQPKEDKKRKSVFVPDMNGPMSYQLLLNYCFGHEKSTLLFCPYGLLTSFINHSHDNPNTKVVWSKEMRHPEWREQDSKKWAEEYHTGVSIDFVALRDIEEDEEILIDYGEAWEKAWQEHVREFVPRENYIPAYELNEMEDIVYRTIDDKPYELEGVQLHCRRWYVQKFVKDIDDDQPCQILKKLDGDRYVVRLVTTENKSKSAQTEYTTGEMLWNVPSDAFFFWDMPYMRDHHMSNSFRHAMMLPDEIFPEIWKNKKRDRKRKKK